MFGRLGSVYFLHLAEARARQRRLSQPVHAMDAGGADANLAVFLRLIGVIALGLGAAFVVSAIVG